MLSGVSKSGSPAPSPMTSRPAALSARALSVTAMVADGLMRLSKSASKAIFGNLRARKGANVLKADPGRGKAQTLMQPSNG